MNNGDRFPINGYEVVASMQSVRGGGPSNTEEYLVLNNNSSHYLVAHRERQSNEAFLDKSYSYVSNTQDENLADEIIFATYVAALGQAVYLAVTH